MESVISKFESIFNEILEKYNELKNLVSAVEIMSDHKLYYFYLKKIKELEPIAEKMIQSKKLDEELDSFKQLKFNSSELEQADIDTEIQNLKKEKQDLFMEMKAHYMSSKIDKQESATVEITSKDDSDFVEYLENLFLNFSKTNRHKANVTLRTDNSRLLEFEGFGVYKVLEVFSGKLKRIFRGKETECLVVVLNENQEDIVVDEDDLEFQTSKSSGAGGQHINKTESAIKVIHKPTGIFAECQEERSQIQNKEKAVERLYEKIAQINNKNREKNIENQRKNIKNKLFGATPVMIFDFDANVLIVTENKLEYKLKDIESGEIITIFEDCNVS